MKPMEKKPFEWLQRATTVIGLRPRNKTQKRAEGPFEDVNGIRYYYTINDGKAVIKKAIRVGDTFRGELVLPESLNSYPVTGIKKGAISSFYNLTKVVIPECLTSIQAEVFSLSIKLTEITVEGNNTEYASADGVLFTRDMETICCYPAGRTEAYYSIPDSVKQIGDFAFYNAKKLAGILIPAGTEKIGERAFFGCASLKGLNIPEGVTSIKSATFNGCTALTNISIPDGIEDIAFGAFANCTSLTGLTLPGSIRQIGGSVFLSCSALENLIYEGTQGQWETEVRKGFHWNAGTPPEFAVSFCPRPGQPEQPERDFIPWTPAPVQDWNDYSTWQQEADPSKQRMPESVPQAAVKNPVQPAEDEMREFIPEEVSAESVEAAEDEMPEFIPEEAPAEPDEEAEDETPESIPEEAADLSGSEEEAYSEWIPDDDEVQDAAEWTAEETMGTDSDEPDETLSETVPEDPYASLYELMPETDEEEPEDSFEETPEISRVFLKGVEYELDSTDRTARVLGTKKKSAEKVKIRASIQANGKKYKVTGIAGKAFNKRKKLKKVTIGKNIRTIGKEVFRGCDKLDTVVIKTTRLTSSTVRDKAFKGVSKKAKIQCPMYFLIAYQKLLLRKGVPKSTIIR